MSRIPSPPRRQRAAQPAATPVGLRLAGPTRESVEQAIDLLRRVHGDRFSINQPPTDRISSCWMAYAVLEVPR